MSTERSDVPRLLKQRSSRTFITTVVSFAGFTDTFMYGLLVPATPTALTTRAGIHSKDLQTWNSVLLALFGVGLLLSSPVAGYVADKCKSRRWPYLAALGGIAVGTALLCIGTHIGLWIAGKLLQGAASAVVWVVGNALVADTVGEEGIAESMGWTTMACSVGLLAGPLVGGVVYQYGGYYAIFGIAFGLIAVDIALRLALIEKKYAMKWLNVEEAIEAQSTKQDPEKNVVEDQKVSTASQDDTHYKPPRSPVIILLSSPRVLSAIWGNLIVSITMTSFDSVLPLFVHENFGWQQSGQGLVFLPLVVPHALSPLAGSLMDRFPKATRYIVGAAFLSSVPAMVLLRFVKENSVGHKVLLCVLLTFVGIFTSVALPAFFADVINVVKQKDLQSPGVFSQGGAVALGVGLANIGFATGSIVGPFFAGFIRQDSGSGTMGWALGVLAGVTTLPTVLLTGGWILRSTER